MKTKIIFILGILVSLSSGGFFQTNLPTTTVESFFKFYRSRADVFNSREVGLRKGWFSAELNRLFQYELKREGQFEKTNPNEKPAFGDGFPFQPYDECYKNNRSYKNAVKVGPASLKDSK